MKTEFNPENKKELTYREALGPAMEITDQEDATRYKEAYIKWQMSFGQSLAKAEETVNINLGYYAGYYSEETRKRIERLFKCSHPIFGAIQENGRPTDEEALQCGRENKTLKELRA